MSDAHYEGVDNLEALEEAVRYNRFLAERIRSEVGRGPALDFGAGIGTIARALREIGLDVTCLEPDPALRSRLEAHGLATFGDVAEIPEGSCECIYSLNVLEHVEGDAAVVAALAARLRPGGKLLLYVPAFPILYSSMDRAVGHHRRYRVDTLVPLVEAAGLEVVRAEYVDSLGFLASLAYRAFGSSDGSISRRSVAFYDRFVFPSSRVLDRVLHRVGGKNLWLVARRPGAP